MSRLHGVAISGTGSALPAHVVRNDAFADTLDTSDEWIRTRTGIRERRLAALGETSATLGTQAARAALAAANLEPADVDLIVCGTVTPDLMCPSTACLIQAGLGCRSIPAFDVTAACSGFIYALGVADKFVKAGGAKHALVIGAEVLSRVADYTDRNTCILFGDGAGAAVVSRSNDLTAGVHNVRLFSDGTRQNLVQMPSMVTPDPPPGATLPQLRYLRMQGREVFKWAVTRMTELIERGRAECSEYGKKLSLVIPHQVNSRIIDAAVEASGLPPSSVMVNLDRYGNTSAASVPIALDEAIAERRCGKGDTVLLVAFGGGLTWSSSLITL